MKEKFCSFLFMSLLVNANGRPEPPILYNFPSAQVSVSFLSQHNQSPQALGLLKYRTIDSTPKINEPTQQQYLDSKYKFLQLRKQEQLLKEKELEMMKEEIMKGLLELESKKEEIIRYGPQRQNLASLQYKEPLKNMATLGYEAPAESVAQPQYGVPTQVPSETAAVAPQPIQDVLCDERKPVGPIRIFRIKTHEHGICNIMFQAFDRCPGSDPIDVAYDGAEHPGACEVVTKALNTVQLVGNTATRASIQAVRVAQYAVDTFDTVKDFYTEMYRKWQQKRIGAKAHAGSPLKEPQSLKGGYN